jgi:hypothetical protein
MGKLRKDKAVRQKSATHLHKRFLADIDFWYDLWKAQAVLATRDQDPAVRMSMQIIRTVLAEVREVEDVVPVTQTAPVIVQVNVGSDRGTGRSREVALQHQQDQRITLTVDGEGTASAEPDDRLHGESIRAAVPQEPR